MSTSTPLPSRKAVLERTPVAQITTSAAIVSPPSVFTLSGSLAVPDAISDTLVDVRTLMPLLTHQSLIMVPMTSFVMRETMRFSISITVRSTLRAARASRIMQPIKPAPIRMTLEPASVLSMILCASASDQQLKTLSESIPGIGGRVAVAPVAINNLS